MMEGKTVLITGCNRGLGECVNDRLCKGRGQIYLPMRERKALSLIIIFKNCLLNIMLRLYRCTFDLTSSEEMMAGIRLIKAANRNVDVLVNSAGISHSGLFQMTSANKIRQVFEANFFANIELSQHISKIMMKQKSGSIVNIASILGEDASAGNCAYGTSKAALIALTKVMAIELAPQGIRVNAVCPGALRCRHGINSD